MTSQQPLDYNTISNRLKLLAHPERLQMLDALRRDAECVCHLEALLGKPQPYVSQQLRFLRQAGLIVDEKEGQNVYYRLVDTEVMRWLDQLLGPVTSEHPAMAAHKQVIACPCPKCVEETEIVLVG
jgi:ArsR family transcriptional regulator